tara:strand:+ start:8436 stop:8660 length:225 start_codon:yes stop_codon:yes gene_type:complete
VSLPDEGLISIVCETFTCTPDIALKQNWKLVKSIMDYRLAEQAKQTFNSDASKMTPPEVRMWKQLNEAQNGKHK